MITRRQTIHMSLSQTHVRWMISHKCTTRESMCVCATCAFDEVFCLQSSPCSYALFGRVSTACVSSPGDWAASWAVSIASHTQQYVVISHAPPRPRAPFSALGTFHVEDFVPKILRQLTRTHCCPGCVFQRVFHAPSGARVSTEILVNIHHTIIVVFVHHTRDSLPKIK